MKTIFIFLVAAVCLFSLSGCTGTPVQLGSRLEGPAPEGTQREVVSSACGFQLLWFIPIQINNRLQRAYEAIQNQAGSDFIANVEVQERWVYGFVGTGYCTDLKAKVIHAGQ